MDAFPWPATALELPSVNAWHVNARSVLLQQAKKYDKARWAFERAALGQERQGSPWQAGKLIEQAVTCSKETGDLTNLIELTK